MFAELYGIYIQAQPKSISSIHLDLEIIRNFRIFLGGSVSPNYCRRSNIENLVERYLLCEFQLESDHFRRCSLTHSDVILALT